MLPLYSLKAAAGYFGAGESVELEAWIEVGEIGKLDEKMFVARTVGRPMEPTIYDGDYVVLRANPVGSRQGKLCWHSIKGLQTLLQAGRPLIKIVTLYEPDPELWLEFKVRKHRHRGE